MKDELCHSIMFSPFIYPPCTMCEAWICYNNSSWKIRTFSFVEEVKSFGGFLTHCYMNQTIADSLAFQVYIFHILHFFPSFSLHFKLCQNTTFLLCFFPLTITKRYITSNIFFCHIFQFQLYTVFIFFVHANNHFLSFDTLMTKQLLYLEIGNFNHAPAAQLWNFHQVTEAQEHPCNQNTHNVNKHKIYITNNGNT